jgi:hypothetical protein
MSPWQLARQVRYLLRQRKWYGVDSNEKVFRENSVRVTATDIEDFLAQNPGSPCCKINLGRRSSDPQAKGYVAIELLVTLAVQVMGDELSENAELGANRSAGQGSSNGRGLSEIESELMATLEDVTAMQGIQVQGYSSAAVETSVVDAALNFVYCEYTFLFRCTSQLTWLGPTSLVASGVTGGSVPMTWKHAPISWASINAVGGQIIRYAAGSTPPATYDAGLAGPSVSNTADAATISGLSSGPWSISIFTAYKESGAASGADRWSPPTSITVTVP